MPRTPSSAARRLDDLPWDCTPSRSLALKCCGPFLDGRMTGEAAGVNPHRRLPAELVDLPLRLARGRDHPPPLPQLPPPLQTPPPVWRGAAPTSPASWNSAIVWAPPPPMQVRIAPTRFSVPSVLDVGPSSSRSSVVSTPTVIRVPRGSSAWPVDIPQEWPFASASSVRAKAEPSITASAPAASALQTSPPLRIPPSVITGT